MNPDDLASKGYRNIARRLLGDSVPLMDIRIKKQGFWSKTVPSSRLKYVLA